VSAPLRLVPLREDHLERVRVWRTSEEVTRFMYTDPVLTPEGQAAWYRARVLGEPTSRWWIVEAEGRPVGLANLVDVDAVHRRCHWGLYLGEPSARGQGWGAQVLRALFAYGFGTLGLERMVGEAFAWNEAAVELYVKEGGRVEGRLRHHVYKRGAWHDVVVVGILREEWEARRGARGAEAVVEER